MIKRELKLCSDLSDNQRQFNHAKEILLDPLAKDLANKVEWWHLDQVSNTKEELFPVAVIGNGNPILLIHGFDSSFLEYRRLVPHLARFNKLIIPDLYGFGFTPRPIKSNYGMETILLHLSKIIKRTTTNCSIGVIGASMGGCIAMELARRNPNEINRLLLLSPAGLTTHPKPVPKPLDHLGVCFLKNKFVRKQLCMKAFANPKESVGIEEEQIASIHLNVEGWGRSLAAFARSGGVANSGVPLPNQPVKIIWGMNDNILSKTDKDLAKEVFKCNHEEIPKCGHLPHLDIPEDVANKWINF